MRDAVAVLYRNAAMNDQRTCSLAYEQQMEKIFTKDRDLKAAAILERLFTLEPDHAGATHYLIHSNVPPLDGRGLPYARRYADLAPDAPLALHTPARAMLGDREIVAKDRAGHGAELAGLVKKRGRTINKPLKSAEAASARSGRNWITRRRM